MEEGVFGSSRRIVVKYNEEKKMNKRDHTYCGWAPGALILLRESTELLSIQY